MEKLIKGVFRLRDKCQQYQEDLDSITQKSPRCFSMIFNKATVVVELLSHYFELWKNPAAHGIRVEDIEETREENAERCKEITKWLFVDSLSAMEYCMKETMNLYPNLSLAKWCRKQQQRRRVYLSGIVAESERIGIINNTDYKFWNCIVDVRNSVVHNNAIADKDKTCQVDGTIVSFVKGKMLRGKLDFFVKLTDKAIDIYYSWIRSTIKGRL